MKHLILFCLIAVGVVQAQFYTMQNPDLSNHAIGQWSFTPMFETSDSNCCGSPGTDDSYWRFFTNEFRLKVADNRHLVTASNQVVCSDDSGRVHSMRIDSIQLTSAQVLKALNYTPLSSTMAAGNGTIVSNAVTINKQRGRITLSNNVLVGVAFSFTFTNSFINPTSSINLQMGGNGTTLNVPINAYVKTQATGSCVINLVNLSLLSILNTGAVIDFVVFN